MAPRAVIGLVLIAIGIIVIAVGGYSSFTTTETVAKAGPLKLDREKEHRLPIGPLLGGAVIVGGVVLIVTSKTRS